MSAALEITGLQKTYANGFQALKGIDLKVEEGDFFALLGPNGAGKSTTIGIVSSLVSKTQGNVKICGIDIDDDFSLAKKQIGIVPQEFNFNVFENVEDVLIHQAGYYGIPMISHGDFLCTDDVDYITFRNQVRSDEWQSEFLNKPIAEREEIAKSMRDESQEATAEKSNAITDVNAVAVSDFLLEHTPDLFIHGHTHRPNIHNIESENLVSKRIVLGDWGATGWYLALNSNNIDLQEFNI